MWFVFWVGRGLLAGIGWIVVPYAVKKKAYSKKLRHLWTGAIVDQYYFTWRLLWLWDNDEEGCAWYTEKDGDPADIEARIIYSSCVRNPVNNLRYVPIVSLKIDPKRVRFIGKPHFQDPRAYDSKELEFWYFCWHGFYGNFRRQYKKDGKTHRFWIGHKIYPGDVFGVFDHRAKSAGFGSQFKRIE
jgi:hypothetical protein